MKGKYRYEKGRKRIGSIEGERERGMVIGEKGLDDVRGGRGDR